MGFPQALTDIDAAAVREHHVHQNDVEGLLPERKGFLGIDGVRYLVFTRLVQIVCDNLGDVDIVLDQKNLDHKNPHAALMRCAIK